jgi:hypothetical protein
MTDLLADPPTGRIISTCNQRVHRFIGALRCQNLTQHNYNFTAQRH